MQDTQSNFHKYLATTAALLFVITPAGFEAPATAQDISLDASESVAETSESEEFQRIQTSMKAVANRALPSVVAVLSENTTGSGVIVSADGYVLTARHTVGRIGDRLRFRLVDGRKLNGKVVGTVSDVDAALLKITTPGSWDFTPLASEEEYPKPGDWCLAIGHSRGFKPQRPPPVRAGRITQANRHLLTTDCVTIHGDSGGPLLSLDGKIIGIAARIHLAPNINFFVPIHLFNRHLEQMKRGEDATGLPPSFLFSLFDANENGTVEPDELADPAKRELYQKYAEQYGFSAASSQRITDLRRVVGMDIAANRKSEIRRIDFLSSLPSDSGRSLKPIEGKNGMFVRDSFRSAVGTTNQSVLRLEQYDETVGYGTVVDESGLFVCKASDTPDDVRCFWQGREVRARRVATSEQHDLLWMRVKEDDVAVKPINWSDKPRLTLCDWLATVGEEKIPLSIGVVSVRDRRIEAETGYLGLRSTAQHDKPIIGDVSIHGPCFGHLRPGDLILKFDGKQISSFSQVSEMMQSYKSGQYVSIVVKRNDSTKRAYIRLTKHPTKRRAEESRVSRKLSKRRDDFALAVEHDSLIQSNWCGTPIVDIEGNFRGINIATADRHSSYAIPAHELAAEYVRVLAQSGDAQ